MCFDEGSYCAASWTFNFHLNYIILIAFVKQYRSNCRQRRHCLSGKERSFPSPTLSTSERFLGTINIMKLIRDQRDQIVNFGSLVEKGKVHQNIKTRSCIKFLEPCHLNALSFGLTLDIS